LFWIKNFKQGGGGVAAEIDADLVDLIEHDYRIV